MNKIFCVACGHKNIYEITQPKVLRWMWREYRGRCKKQCGEAKNGGRYRK